MGRPFTLAKHCLVKVVALLGGLAIVEREARMWAEKPRWNGGREDGERRSLFLLLPSRNSNHGGGCALTPLTCAEAGKSMIPPP